jgi:hypothetical protein
MYLKLKASLQVTIKASIHITTGKQSLFYRFILTKKTTTKKQHTVAF